MNIQIPSSFAIPREFRSTLPGDVQTWLDSVESRIDGLTLGRIQEEAKEITGQTGDSRQLFKLGRRVFYDRMQHILDILHPGLEVGIDILWNACSDDVPGSAVVWALNDFDGGNDTSEFRQAIRAEFEEAEAK
jgi:hypothetical protein